MILSYLSTNSPLVSVLSYSVLSTQTNHSSEISYYHLQNQASLTKVGNSTNIWVPAKYYEYSFPA